MSRAAMEVAEKVKEILQEAKGGGDNMPRKKSKAAAAEAAPKAERKTKAPKAQKAPKERNALAGIRTAPKLPGLLLGTAISRAVVGKALKAYGGDWTEDESHEVARLKARLEARG